eukprot:297753-Amorphochlora_amoeboformis.AAC.1
MVGPLGIWCVEEGITKVHTTLGPVRYFKYGNQFLCQQRAHPPFSPLSPLISSLFNPLPHPYTPRPPSSLLCENLIHPDCRISDGPRPLRVQILDVIHIGVVHIWVAMGNYWVATSQTCSATSPELFTAVKYWVHLQAVVLLIGTLAILASRCLLSATFFTWNLKLACVYKVPHPIPAATQQPVHQRAPKPSYRCHGESEVFDQGTRGNLKM